MDAGSNEYGCYLASGGIGVWVLDGSVDAEAAVGCMLNVCYVAQVFCVTDKVCWSVYAEAPKGKSVIGRAGD